ncbi:MAG: 3-dehydroquinate synthase [Eubacterium sp.]|nr:3-dehydroquinate synthase [Eubacterium sp.]
MKKLFVNTAQGYDILIEKGILSSCGEYIRNCSSAKKICIVSDTNVFPLYGNTVKAELEKQGFEVIDYIFPAGEESKTTATVISIIEFLAENGLTRDDLVVALGGGVCGDMAGFAAAVYLRGIDFVQLPTSLLAQVDSSVGGKTAVDLPQGKNLCGAFHQPRLVLIDTLTLETLPEHYFSDGMAEAIKTGCIKSQALFEKIESKNARDIIEEIVFECVSIKAEVVEADEKEKGERALLNFGHTAGHAIERLHSFKTVSHGEAVGIGMLIACTAGENNGLTSKGTAKRIEDVLKKYNLKTADTNSLSSIVNAMSSDKKRTGNSIKLVMLSDIGEAFIENVSYKRLNAFFGV